MRALRLLIVNPRVFVKRLVMVGRHPYVGARALAETAERRSRIAASYASWLSECREVSTCFSGPLISVVMPVHNTPRELLQAAVESVRQQTYQSWELCIADDASTASHVAPLLENYAEGDSRIRVVWRTEAGHISAASNSAASLATGEFLTFLDHDDVLRPHALARVAEAAVSDERVDFIYSDEDKLDETGQRVDPFFKPGWSPTLLLSCNYITHLAAVRRTLFEELGGFRLETVGSQDHDLFLRVSERARAVAHIPDVLYSWRMAPLSAARSSSAKPYAIDAARRALTDAVRRRSMSGKVIETHLSGIFAIHSPPSAGGVSILLHGRARPSTFRLLPRGERVREVITPRTHWPRAVATATAEYLVFLDAECTIGHSDLAILLSHLNDDEVAVVGGSVRSLSGEVYEAGVTIDPTGGAHYAYLGLSLLPQPNFYLNLKDLPHESSAVSAAFAAVRRDTLHDLGGVRSDADPVSAVIELCVRALNEGRRVLYVPGACARRASPLPPLIRPFPSLAGYRDPFWNPNLNFSSGDGTPFVVRTMEIQVALNQARLPLPGVTL